ncbi:MAG TPA: pitrilysin family protein, partial [Kofleriaceae bacterium]|nr:pitrilysin family protein [Kofleriaceae bacterium]
MRVLVAMFVAACATGSALPRPPSPPRTTSLGIDLSGFNLGNGLRVVFVHDPHATEVQVTTRYRVGVVDEPDDQRGIAHLVEHLMFEQIIGQETIFARLQNIATSFNAFTTVDATSYFERALPSHLGELLAIEAVRIGLRCTSVSQSAFEREREVVINELRMKDTATVVRHDVFAGLYTTGHPYRKLAADTEASVRAITREQACAFADAHYAPGNAVMVVSGNLDPTAVAKALEKYVMRVPARATAAAVQVQPIAPIARDVKITS